MADIAFSDLAGLQQTGDVHLFENDGICLMYHRATNLLYRIPSKTYKALATGRLAGGIAEGHAASEVEYLTAAVRWLATKCKDSDADASRAAKYLLAHRPRNLMLFLTNQCNFKCDYCYETGNGKEIALETLSTESVRLALDSYFDRAAGRPVANVTFFGGEPLLRFDLMKEAVAYAVDRAQARDVSIGFCVTTNGSVMSDEIIDVLIKYQFGVMLSMDGPPEIHDKHRRFRSGEASFAKVYANAKRLLEAQKQAGVLPFKIRATLCSDTYREYHNVYAYFLREFPGARIMIGESTGTANCLRNVDAPMCDEEYGETTFRGFLAELRNGLLQSGTHNTWRAHREGFVKFARKMAGNTCTHGLPELCGICRNMLAVGGDHRYYPCHRFVGLSSYALGDIERGLDVERVLEVYLDLTRVYRESCRTCWANKLCGGECPYYLSTESGRFSGPSQEKCKGIRRGYEWLLQAYCYARHSPLLAHVEAPQCLVSCGPVAQKGSEPLPPVQDALGGAKLRSFQEMGFA